MWRLILVYTSSLNWSILGLTLKGCEEKDSLSAGGTPIDPDMPEYSSTEEDTSDTEPVQLQPFIHQVGGHSCVLRFNETTLCKPLITRELLFYESMPSELKVFIPDYRGIIEVELHEDGDGYMTLIGYPVERQDGGQRTGNLPVTPKGFERGQSPSSSGSETESPNSPMTKSRNINSGSSTDSYSVRLLRSGSVEVSTQTQTMFHSTDPKLGQKTAALNPWSLKCHKRQLAKMMNENQDSNLRKFILLENVAAKFKFPCILDLKMGTRQHGDDAPEAKKKSQTKKCASTTSSSVGLRLIGMQVFQSTSGEFVCQNKYHGRKLSVNGFKEVIEMFLYNGESMRTELLAPILDRLQKLYKIIEKHESFRFYSSSLLIMYGGINNCETNPECSTSNGMANISDTCRSDNLENYGTNQNIVTETNHNCVSVGTQNDDDSFEQMSENCLVDVRMIDFAHSTHSGFQNDAPHQGVDRGYLFGLQNLIDIFKDIQNRYSKSPNG